MKLYKLKHLPTGLYFTPSKGYGNLSTTGKVYINRVPDLKWVESIRIRFYTDSNSEKAKRIAEFFKIDIDNAYKIDLSVHTQSSDWEIIEIQ